MTGEMVNLESYELDLLVRVLNDRYSYDFQDYSKASLKRRILRVLDQSDYETISDLLPRVIHDRAFSHTLVEKLTVQVTEMYRDPEVFNYLREMVVPLLKTWPYVKIWVAGCSSGQEVYSLAILLHEEGLYDRVRLFATDINQSALREAKEGIYATKAIENYSANYCEAGGKHQLMDYFTESYEFARIHQSLQRNILFSRHNLAVDQVFSEVHLVLCRNVLIYFNRDLQDRVFRVFHESLVTGGMLCLGSRETLQFSPWADSFDARSDQISVYRKLPMKAGAA